MSQQIPMPLNEVQRLEVLRQMCLLDTPPDPVFDQLTALAAQTFGVPMALVSLMDAGRQWFKSRVGIAARETPRDIAFCAYAIMGTEPMVVLDAQLDDRFADNPFVTGFPFVRFYAGAPLITKEGTCPGTLCIIGTEPRAAFSEDDQKVLQQLAALVTSRMETLRSIGYVDPLTKLPNRTRFVDDLSAWIADKPNTPNDATATAVDICGGEYYSAMVNALGYSYAEGFLVASAQRLQQTLPEGTTLYRIGNTLFGFIHEAATDQALVPLFAGILAAFERPIDHAGIPHTASPTLGCMRLAPTSVAADIHRSLLALADSLRHEGRAWGFFEAAHDEVQKRAFRLLSSLPAALMGPGQLQLFYQPRVEVSTGECVGVEALLRWTHPEMGTVSPAEFIPLAENTALMSRVTRWVLKTALSQASKWQRDGHAFTVALNVSAIDLDQEDFGNELCDLLKRCELDPALVELEFTEGALMLHPERSTAHLRRLRDLGLQIAIDDFGTGYSNLSYLKHIPATTLKIDQSFIRNVLSDTKDRAIVPSMIQLGHDLSHRVVAEGIENREIYDQLAAWSCDEAQGYWIGKPMPGNMLEGWLAARAAAH